MLLRLLCTTVSITILSLSFAALADDVPPPLFVSTTGVDMGSCEDSAAPCKSIGYALRRVGKNGQIRVANGSFELAAMEDVVYMLSGAIDVRGGFHEADNFAVRSGPETTLIGVPAEFAGDLARRGFRVIADSKSIGDPVDNQSKAIVENQLSLQANAAATPCVDGSAGTFACDNVDLLAHVAERTASARGADIWGFMDLNTNREYAIVAYSVGTAVFDVSNPEDPREVGFVDGQATTWRDIKVLQFWNVADRRWNAFAYVTADNASDGLVIIDLSQLPQRIARIDYPSDFAAAHNVYLTNTDFSTGLALDGRDPVLILAGTNVGDGRFRAYDLSNPASPAFIAAPGTPANQPGGDRLYMHDAASMSIGDARKDSQCVNANNAEHCDVLFDFNESTFDIWDVTQPSNPTRLSRTPYTNADYVHSGWWSEDKQYLFVQDETDERDQGLQTTLRVFSIADLTAPTFAGSWSGPTNAIDHNGFVRGNRYYMSNYARGLTILDISDPASPSAAGYFDTYPASDTVGFPGAWGVYPFLPSGVVLISDIDSGLYVAADKTLTVPAGTLAFAASSFGLDESQPGAVIVRRNGGSEGAIAVEWELIGATASVDDVTVRKGILSWAAGDASDRIITVDAVDDGISEGLERLLVTLKSPSGGATLSSPSLSSVYVADPGDVAEIRFATDSLSVNERGFATAIAVVNRTGNAQGEVSVDFSVGGGDASSGQDYSGPASGTLSWGDGDAEPKWIEFAITNDGSTEADEFFNVTLSNSTGASLSGTGELRINIVDSSAANQAPNAVAGSSQTASPGNHVTLNGDASNDPDGDALDYAWTQTLGPTVSLSNANSMTASFTAPSVNSDTLLRFELRVMDSGGLSDTATASVTVVDYPGSPAGSGGGPLSFLLLGALGLAAARKVTTRRGAS
jgi:choice-of-anchor B domain-containing protein